MRASFVMSGVASGIRRNLSMTVALILNTAIALAFAGGALLVHKEISKFKAKYENKLGVSIYLCGDTRPPGTTCKAKVTDAQRQAVQAKLASDTRIRNVKYYNEDAAFEQGKKVLDKQSAEALERGTLPAYFTIQLKDIGKDYDAVAADYSKLAGVDLVQNQDDSLKTILNLFDRARLGAIIIALIIMVCAMILMANAIQVAASQRREETGIMRLVGASRWMTQLPFMIEAVIAATIGGILAIILDGIGKKLILDGIFRQQVERNVLPRLDMNDVLVAGGTGALIGIALSAITAFATLRLLVRL